MIMSITPTKQTIFSFDEKILIWFKKFDEKRIKLHHFFKIHDQIQIKKNSWQPWYFLMKIWT